MHNTLENFYNLCRMIKIEHSIFALPYAWGGAFLAAGGTPTIWTLFFLTIAMIGVRSFAMTFNRIADLEIDRNNPRTKNRPLVTGAISLREAWCFSALMCVIALAACYFLNLTCFVLCTPALVFAGAYSYMKRISPFCHYWLGATLGLAPLAGWLAVSPESLGLPAILLCLAVTFWVAAFDIYYSFQDMDFDKNYGLKSIPAELDGKGAMSVAGLSHAITIIFLVLTGIAGGLGWPWYAFCAVGALILLAEHHLVHPEDLRHINMAFFTLNGVISILMLAGIICGIYF